MPRPVVGVSPRPATATRFTHAAGVPMSPSRWLRSTLLATLLAVVACSGGSSITGGDNTGGTGGQGNTSCASKFTASVNGTAWCSISTVGNWFGNQSQVVITGAGFTGAVSWSLTLSVSSSTGPGTYPLTTTAPLRFAVAGSSAGVGYVTTEAGGSGTVTFTTLTTTHATGTYSFTAVANTGGTGTVTVTNGSFDLMLTPKN